MKSKTNFSTCMGSLEIFIIIPVYQPGKILISIISDLLRLDNNISIIVINDGSDTEHQPLFEQIEKMSFVYLVNHISNLGKGEALKSGFDFYLSKASPDSPGVVTADADGQHCPKDIINLCHCLRNQNQKLHLGFRDFSAKMIPLRSRFGNRMTLFLFKLFFHVSLADSQTGLRAIPRIFMKSLLKSKRSRYDFELEMLVLAIKLKIAINETPIKTIYEDGNSSSHFNPIIDSLKVYLVLFHFFKRLTK